MPQVSATYAARKFSEMLDAVEHRRETYTITRNGHEVARIQPVREPNGRALKEFLMSREPDPEWWEEIKEARKLLVDRPHSWDD